MSRKSFSATRTIVSWTRFCEWVQGKTVVSETDEEAHGHSIGTTLVCFADGSKAVFISAFDYSFGEKEVEAPLVEIEEAP